MRLRFSVNTLSLSVLLACSSMYANAETYRVEELVQSSARHAFAMKSNNQGSTLVISREQFEYNIDIDKLDFDDTSLTDNINVDAVQAGQISADDYYEIIRYLRLKENAQKQQQLNSYSSYVFSDSYAPVAGFDVIDPDTQDYTSSVDVQAFAINDNGWIAGWSSSPYEDLAFVNSNNVETIYQSREFQNRGFVTNGQWTTQLLPPEMALSGRSEAIDVNNNGLVVGHASFLLTDTASAEKDACEDTEGNPDFPASLCKVNLNSTQYNYANGEKNFDADTKFHMRAYQWQLDENGEVLSSQPLGAFIEETDDLDTRVNSKALAVNDNGIAVGFSDIYYKESSSIIRSYAAIFRDGQVIEITDQQEYLSSQATDINNNNIVVGQSNRYINNSPRSKFFVYDLDNDVMTHPEDFFTGSSSVANSINNSGVVVGEAEYESSFSGTRRRHGFMYDMASETFTDLNTFLSCDSGYEIVEANHINDLGVISATALVSRPKKNLTGTVETDDSGNTLYEEVLVPVRLHPVAGEIESCEDAEQDKHQRQGGGISYLLGGLLLSFGFRRYRAK